MNKPVIILRDQPFFQEVIDRTKWEEYRIQDMEKYVRISNNRLRRLAETLSPKMEKDPVPDRILNEVAITNTSNRQEGRIDAIFEYPNSVETVEWKTYADHDLVSFLSSLIF